MSLLQIVRRSLRQHLLSTVITAFSIALASGLMMSVWVVKEQAHSNFTGVNSGFDAVFGARGAKLQLVLNSIFHLSEAMGLEIRFQAESSYKQENFTKINLPI